jgi:hypothetical protein
MNTRAKAVLTFSQISTLVNGDSVTIRIPKQDDAPSLEVELTREPIPDGSRVDYSFSSSRTNARTQVLWSHPVSKSREVPGSKTGFRMEDHKFVMPDFDKLFDNFESSLTTLWKNFDRIFKLPSSK